MKMVSLEAIDLLQVAFENILSECVEKDLDFKKETTFAINFVMEKRVHLDIAAYTSAEIIAIKKEETDFMEKHFNRNI